MRFSPLYPPIRYYANGIKVVLMDIGKTFCTYLSMYAIAIKKPVFSEVFTDAGSPALYDAFWQQQPFTCSHMKFCTMIWSSSCWRSLEVAIACIASSTKLLSFLSLSCIFRALASSFFGEWGEAEYNSNLVQMLLIVSSRLQPGKFVTCFVLNSGTWENSELTLIIL